MTPRFILASVFVISLIGGVAAKEKAQPKTSPSRTWKFMSEYVLNNGGADSIKAPSARNLGYSSDQMPAYSLGVDLPQSKDGQEHSIYVIYEKSSNGAPKPKEIVLDVIRVTETASHKELDAYNLRISLTGKLIKGLHAYGIVGDVMQKPIAGDSRELKTIFAKESDFYLKEVELTQLKK